LNIPSSVRAVTDLAVRIVPPQSGTITKVYFDAIVDLTGPPTGVRYALLADASGLPGSEITGLDILGPNFTFQWPVPAATVSWPVTGGTAYWIVLKQNSSAARNCVFRFVKMNIAAGSWSGDGNAYARYVPVNSDCLGRPGGTTPWEAVEHSQIDGAIGTVAGHYNFVPAVAP
jgi:hypothetical protein